MSTMFVITAIAVLLGLSIVISSIAQMQEYKESERKQLALQHKRQGEQTQELLDELIAVNLDNGLRVLLINHMIDQYNQVKELLPKDFDIESLLHFAEDQLKSLDGQVSPNSFIIPESDQAITKLMINLNKLRRKLSKIKKEGKVGHDEYERYNTEINQLSLKLEIEGHIQRGKAMAEKQQLVTAQNHYQFALNQLLKSSLEDEYVPVKEQEIRDLIQSLRESPSKNHSLSKTNTKTTPVADTSTIEDDSTQSEG